MVITKDHVFIDKPLAVVWKYLEDPEVMKAWNPKVRSVTPMSWDQKKGLGFRYGIMYELSGKASELLAEFVHYQPPLKLVIRHTGGRFPRGGYAEEIYELSEKDGGTLLMQTVLMQNSGINVLLRLFIACIVRFGKPTGTPYLVLFKNLVEEKEG